MAEQTFDFELKRDSNRQFFSKNVLPLISTGKHAMTALGYGCDAVGKLDTPEIKNSSSNLIISAPPVNQMFFNIRLEHFSAINNNFYYYNSRSYPAN